MIHLRLQPLPRNAGSSEHKQNATQAPDFSSLNNSDEEDEDPEDIFSAFLPHIYPDDILQFHGDPGQLLRYESPLYGPLTIMVPHYPTQGGSQNDRIASNSVDTGRALFAHVVWSSALVAAQYLEDAAAGSGIDGTTSPDRTTWSVKGHRVLELGAGAGLPSIISALASASHVTITDHPSSPALLGAIEYNILQNIPASSQRNIESVPHEWGTVSDEDEFARNNKGRYTRIIAADCIWMLHQHENLVKTMLWFLSEGDASNGLAHVDDGTTAVMTNGDGSGGEEGRVCLVAGLHTGRAIVEHFFDTAVSMGLEVESVYERDLNADGGGSGEVRRAWEPVRAGEGIENRKRWCVVGVLKRARKSRR